ncbi:P-loop containing nucleoside triphosphate hydrolase protein [Glonium stellatum]|uniref:P-loop containing nucleoside triphosphate hydrolase protein n=1 Tax=Glonium stellatum TaxID=574774 RepID=A0A8E2F2S9_9PEZI|nr:P-loop containing nucleoside triphosphate hydrolase protein [Glonium stellatum]
MVRKLYRHDCIYGSCQSRWSEFGVIDEEQEDLTKKIVQIPIVHRHTFDEKHWITSSFTIQSGAIKNLLTKALEKYQDLDMELENWMFEPPYRPIVHRWDRLKELQANATDPTSKQAADTLMEFLAPILASSVDALSQTRRTGKVSFEAVWQIFPPGELVMTKFYGVETICRVIKYERQEINMVPLWVITTEYLDWTGESCGYATTKTTIRCFQGFRRVTALPVYPLSFNDAAVEIKSKMIERGRKFERLRGYHFLTCSGKKVLLELPEERPVSGRVVVDAFAYYRSCNIVKPDLRSLSDSEEKHEDQAEADVTENENAQHSSETDSITDGPELTATAMSERVSRCEDLRALTDEQCLLATPWLKGLDLRTKEWAQFHIDDLAEIVWNDTAFDNLVLPGGEKELAWAFVENKNMSNYAYDDFIPDKVGRGIIILMFGPPGVGKTFTAEAVAEKSRVPLYSMSAGVLGTKPEEVEKSLDRALELCRLWNAMLLLDEADVFLGARTNDGLARNELVSIFLAKLEYYQGILFLTTNRISSIDHAFQSRVDLFLPYSDLTVQARKQVWENFISHVGREMFHVSDADLEKLSKISLNGREIKNLIKSAQLLSFKSGGKITTERLYMLAEKRVKALQLLVN